MTTAELIEKLERADGPSRELFEEAFYACFPPPTHTTIPLVKSINAKSGRFCPDAHSDWSLRLAKFQTMLDAEAWESAALMLLPKGWTGFVAVDADNETWLWPCDGTMGKGFRIAHKIPAIALCIAALKAKEADNG